MEPVAWMDRDGEVMTMPEIPNWCPPHTMLYTEDQLRAAKVEVLRDAASHMSIASDYAILWRMADKIEKGE